MAMGYNPASLTAGVVPKYVVKTTGDNYFIPAYPGQDKKLAPNPRTELVAT